MRLYTTFLTICFAFVLTGLSAQIGLTPYFSTAGDSYFRKEKGSDAFQQFGVGIHYSIRIPNVRIEFFPEVGYAAGNTVGYTENLSATYDFIEETMNAAWFRVPIRFYLLDFKGDCDCPTFSKQGNLVKKGFFLMVVPGARMMMSSAEYGFQNNRMLDPVVGDFTRSGLTWTTGIGAGLDIGLSDAITLTPQVLLERTGDYSFEPSPCPECNQTNLETPFTIFSAGLSLHYRWKK
ncbi:MAG: hypothetical protein KDC24_06385 [Saprospiraceae bacterium]|nr:hypothetical protein [Saprospiraceae bacterium]